MPPVAVGERPGEGTRQPPRPVETVDAGGGFLPSPEDTATASIHRPPADVGGPPRKRPGSILDIILGN